MTAEDQLRQLLLAADTHAKADGESLVVAVESAAALSVEWLEYLRTSEVTGIADVLLDGMRSAILEVAGCLALGLVRPALFSLRAQLDLLFAWLFFKDHDVEWRHVVNTGDGYRLKTDALKYLDAYIPRFRERFGLLLQVKQRREAEPYRLLSAHVHGQSPLVIPSLVELRLLVREIAICREAVDIQREVSEYSSDILAACFADKWASLPSIVVNDLNARLSVPQKKAFF